MEQKNATNDQPFHRFTNYYGENGALAQAAPLAAWPQQTDEQLVLGIRTTEGASYVMIGSFQPDDGRLDTFDWESETERTYENGLDFLQNMWVGNFDDQNSDGTHNAGLQIETYELLFGAFVGVQPHVNVFNVKVPSPFPPEPLQTTNWLSQSSDNTSGIPFQLAPGSGLPDPSSGFLTPSDIQGRSLELGSPTSPHIKAAATRPGDGDSADACGLDQAVCDSIRHDPGMQRSEHSMCIERFRKAECAAVERRCRVCDYLQIRYQLQQLGETIQHHQLGSLGEGIRGGQVLRSTMVWRMRAEASQTRRRSPTMEW